MWLIPRAELPALSNGLRPVTVFGRAVVAAAFVDYRPGRVYTRTTRAMRALGQAQPSGRAYPGAHGHGVEGSAARTRPLAPATSFPPGTARPPAGPARRPGNSWYDSTLLGLAVTSFRMRFGG
ncbi:MAG TPA: hypothetical protein VJT49_04540 [Amycolatopsis sp.]|uniref:hypothetical protein n=1 Tax=Amycolatopsis sp. TaxID=37632 RepID=UPI002B46152C|nr:hypothetical protein [Amycolatopsis sp.]HKS44378.1 hypothetical protein [Amycolatopsis sp.]